MSRIAPINQRFVNAENSFLEVLQKQGGISREGAEKVLNAWRKHNLVKVDSFDGRISVKRGGLLDRENILESFRHAIEENSTCRYCKVDVKANPGYSRKSVFWIHGPGLFTRSGKTVPDLRGTSSWLQMMMVPVLSKNPDILEQLEIVDNKGTPVSWDTIVSIHPAKDG